MFPPSFDQQRRQPWFHFRLRRLIALTTVVAVIVGMAWRLDLPELLRGALAVYLLVFAVWLVVRGPYVYAELRRFRRQKRLLAEKRAQLEQEFGQRRRREPPLSDGDSAASDPARSR